MPCKQLFAGRCKDLNLTDRYAGITQPSVPTADDNVGHPWMAAGDFRLLRVQGPAPGIGKSWTFTLMVNGAASDLSVTLANNETIASDIWDVVSVAPNDVVAIRRSSSGSPSTSDTHRISYEFNGNGVGESSYGGMPTTLDQAATFRRPLFADLHWTSNTSISNRSVVAAAGTVTALRYTLTVAPGTAKSYLFTVYKNGTAQNGGGGTPDTRVTITGTATAGDWAGSMTVAGGDLFWVECAPSGTPAASRGAVGVLFVATTDGESQACGMTLDNLVASSTEYAPPLGYSSLSWGTETTTDEAAGLSSADYYKLYVATSGNSTATFTLRKNGAGTVLSCATAASQSASDLTGTVTIAPGDTWAFEYVAGGSPGLSIYTQWACVQYALAAFKVTVGGVDVVHNIYKPKGSPAFAITYDLSPNGQASFSTYDLDSTSAAYRPSLGDQVIISSAGTVVFVGYVTQLNDGPLDGTGTGTLTQIVARSYAAVFDRQLFSVTYAAGKTVLEVAQYAESQGLAVWGPAAGFTPITLDPAIASGPTLAAQNWDEITYRALFDQLSATAGWIWRLRPDYVVEMFTPGDKAAAFSLTAALKNTVGPVTWRQSDLGYVNYLDVIYAGTYVSATDAGQISTYGGFREAIRTKLTDATAAADYAAAMLARKMTRPKIVTVTTRAGFELPGTTITLTFADRTISGAHLINRVTIRDYSLSGDFQYEYVCSEGTAVPSSSADRLKLQLLGGDGAVTRDGT